MKFELVFVLQLSKVEKTKKDFYRELMQIRLNFHTNLLNMKNRVVFNGSYSSLTTQNLRLASRPGARIA